MGTTQPDNPPIPAPSQPTSSLINPTHLLPYIPLFRCIGHLIEAVVVRSVSDGELNLAQGDSVAVLGRLPKGMLKVCPCERASPSCARTT